tara:strand:+ start:8995 stop:12957 length:3963 start_codon:yes stop_codon:yes gene_type:complete
MYKINNLSKYELGDNQGLLDDFLQYAIKRFGVNKAFKIMLVADSENAQNPLGKTGAYNPATSNIYIYTDGRIFKDILRSISHEVFHHSQNCKGEFDNHDLTLAPGYAQEDDYMREIERGAYEQGNLCLRDWEDRKKKVKLKVMKENKKILKEYDPRQAPFKLPFCKDKAVATPLPKDVVDAGKLGNFDLRGWICDGKGYAVVGTEQVRKELTPVAPTGLPGEDQPGKPPTHVDLPDVVGQRTKPKFDKEFIESFEGGQIHDRLKALKVRQNTIDKIKKSMGWDPKYKGYRKPPTLTQDQILTSIYAAEAIRRNPVYSKNIDSANFFNLVLDVAGFAPIPGDPVDLANYDLKMDKYAVTQDRWDWWDAHIDLAAFFMVGQPIAWVRTTLKGAVKGVALLVASRKVLKALILFKQWMIKLRIFGKGIKGEWQRILGGNDAFNKTTADIDKEIANLRANIKELEQTSAILYSERYAKIMGSFASFEEFIETSAIGAKFANNFIGGTAKDVGGAWAIQKGVVKIGVDGKPVVDVSRLEELKVRIIEIIGEFEVAGTTTLRKARMSSPGLGVPSSLRPAEVTGAAQALEKIINKMPDTIESAEMLAKLEIALEKGGSIGGGGSFAKAGNFWDWMRLNTGKNAQDISFEGIKSVTDLNNKIVDPYIKAELKGRWDEAEEVLMTENLKVFYEWLGTKAPLMGKTTPAIKRAFVNLEKSHDARGGEVTAEEALKAFLEEMQRQFFKSRTFKEAGAKTWEHLTSPFVTRALAMTGKAAGVAGRGAGHTGIFLFNQFKQTFKLISWHPDRLSVGFSLGSAKWPKRFAAMGITFNALYRTPLKKFFRERLTGGGAGDDQWVGFGNTREAVEGLKAKLAGNNDLPPKMRSFFNRLKIDKSEDSDRNTKLIIAGAMTYLPKEDLPLADVGKAIVKDLKETGKMAPADADAIFGKDDKIRPHLKKILDAEEEWAKTRTIPVNFAEGPKGIKKYVEDAEREKKAADKRRKEAEAELKAAKAAAAKAKGDEKKAAQEALKAANIAAAEARIAAKKAEQEEELVNRAVEATEKALGKTSKGTSDTEETTGGAGGTAVKAPGELTADRALKAGLGSVGTGGEFGLNKSPLLKKGPAGPVPVDKLRTAINDGPTNSYLKQRRIGVQQAEALKTASKGADWGEMGWGAGSDTVLKCLAKAPTDKELKKYVKNIRLNTVKYNQPERIKAIQKTWECGAGNAWEVNKTTSKDINTKHPKYQPPTTPAPGPAAPRAPQPPPPRGSIKAKVMRLGHAASADVPAKGQSPAGPINEEQTLNEILEDYHESESEKRFAKLIKGMVE